MSFRMLATMRITDCSTAVSFRYFGATSITTCAETSFWDGVIPTVEAEEKACEAKAKALEEAKAKAETLKEEKAEELSQLQSALTTSRHALKAMKAVDMKGKCEE